jgi:hypothetical protein
VVAAAERFARSDNGHVSVGDVSRRGGGYFPPHAGHRVGMDVDIRPVRRDSRQCRRGVSWRDRAYDRRGTRRLIRSIRAAAQGHVKVIFFNDPVLIRAGLTRWYPGHDDHLHVMFCSPRPRNPAYRCP